MRGNRGWSGHVEGGVKLLREAGGVRIGETERRGIGDERHPVNQVGGLLHGIIESGNARDLELESIDTGE